MPSGTGVFALDVRLGENAFSASGKPDLVFKAFEDFKALIGQSQTGATGRSAARVSSGSKSATKETTERATPVARGEDLPLPAFLSSLKQMKGNAQVAAAIVVWSARHNGNPKLSAPDIRSLWEGTKYRVPSPPNVIRDLNKAVAQGLLRKEGKGQGQVYYANTYEQNQVLAWANEPQ